MSEVKFTPGPWELEDCTIKYIIRKPGDGYITRDICRMDSSTMSAINQKANAHLIAAAPELYEALEEIVFEAIGWEERYPDRHITWLPKARAALTKARGEE